MNLHRRDALRAIGLGLSCLFARAVSSADAPPPRLRIQRLSWAGVRLECGDATLFIDASYDPSSASSASPDVLLAPESKNRQALITHHHGDHFDAAALRSVLGDTGLLVVPESVAPWADTRQFRVQIARLYEPVMLPRGSAMFAAISVPAMDGLGHPQIFLDRQRGRAEDFPWRRYRVAWPLVGHRACIRAYIEEWIEL